MPRPIDNLESAFTEMYEFITDLPSGLDGFESDFDEAFKELENLKVAIAQPGKPLTLNQLRKMDGQPVWCEDVERWALVSVSDAGKWKGVPFALFEKNGVRFEWNIEGRELSLYSYPPAHIDRGEWTAEWVNSMPVLGAGDLETRCNSCGNLVLYETDFCPYCGKAMTPEAWAELERRLMK